MCLSRQQSFSQLSQTVKKTQRHTTLKKNSNRNLNHVKSYDDIRFQKNIASNNLQPAQIKILLNNDKSLKNLRKICQIQEKKKNYGPKSARFQNSTVDKKLYHFEMKPLIKSILQDSIQKQNLLLKNQLFDPFTYFSGSSHLQQICVQESQRANRSRLDSMLGEKSLSKQKTKEQGIKSQKKKLNFENRTKFSSFCQNQESLILNEINNKLKIEKTNQERIIQNSLKQLKCKDLLYEKLDRLESLELKCNLYNKNMQIKEQKIENKENIMNNEQVKFSKKHLQQSINSESQKKKIISISSVYSKKNKESSKRQTPMAQESLYCYKNKNVAKFDMCESLKGSSLTLSNKISMQGNSTRLRDVNCSPKKQVKENQLNYLKMNLNNMQKVRLKLKLNSKK